MSDVQYADFASLKAGAPKDLREEDVTDVFGGLTVKVRGLTAFEKSTAQQAAMAVSKRGARLDPGEYERQQFKFGVIAPKLSIDQVRELHLSAGHSWNTVIAKIDELSDTSPDKLAEAEAAFPGPGDDGE